MKKIFFVLFVSLISSGLFAEGTPNQKKFICGNIQDKSVAVRQASGEEAVDLSQNAIAFSINYYDLLGEDRDLATLAVSGVLTLPASYVNFASPQEKQKIADNFYNLYSKFQDETVKIAVLNKLSVLQIPSDKFTKLLNEYIKAEKLNSEKASLTKAIITTLGTIGDNDSFVSLYLLSIENKESSYISEVNQSLQSLLVRSVGQAVTIIQTGNTSDCRNIFNLTVNSKNISNNLKAEIAENVLARTIYISENAKTKGDDLISIEMDSFSLLTQLKWTRSSKTIQSFFYAAKKEYEDKLLSEDNFLKIITEMQITSPMEAVACLSNYLSELNSKMEQASSAPSEKLVLTIISSLGAIGDKTAFDSLLAVTYYAYPDKVITAARDALARLKW